MLSQKILIERLMSWPLIEARLRKFPAIAKAFPLSMLRNRSDRPPYFCHYMSWRLGTWQDDQLFVRFEALLEHAELLPNWKCEKPLLLGGDFSDFWSLNWQLQVAEYLGRVGSAVSWNKSGPDLSALLGGERIHVECYVYRKSFGTEMFVDEILRKLGNDLRAHHDLCMPFSLPHDASLASELSDLLRPLLDENEMAHKRRLAEDSYPIVLSTSKAGALTIKMEGSAEAYDPSVSPESVGEPTFYLALALRESIDAKACSNNLNSHRPNLLLVNLVLSVDAQFALNRQQDLSEILGGISMPPSIDAFAFAAVGIDQQLRPQQLRWATSSSSLYPVFEHMKSVIGPACVVNNMVFSVRALQSRKQP